MQYSVIKNSIKLSNTKFFEEFVLNVLFVWKYCLFLFFYLLHSYYCMHTIHTRSHFVCISNYSQTQSDWHCWHRMAHSPKQLLFQSWRCSVRLPCTALQPLPLAFSLFFSLFLSPSPVTPLAPSPVLLLISSRGWLHALEESSSTEDYGVAAIVR